jgi:hypothetical protein
MKLATLQKVRQIKIKDIMPFYHVRVFFPYDVYALYNEFFFLNLFSAKDCLPTPVIGKRNQDDPIFGSFGIAEFVGLRIGFDIELHPVDIVEFHSLEKGLPRLHQELCIRVRTKEDVLSIRVRIDSPFLRLIDFV